MQERYAPACLIVLFLQPFYNNVPCHAETLYLCVNIGRQSNACEKQLHTSFLFLFFFSPSFRSVFVWYQFFFLLSNRKNLSIARPTLRNVNLAGELNVCIVHVGNVKMNINSFSHSYLFWLHIAFGWCRIKNDVYGCEA